MICKPVVYAMYRAYIENNVYTFLHCCSKLPLFMIVETQAKMTFDITQRVETFCFTGETKCFIGETKSFTQEMSKETACVSTR